MKILFVSHYNELYGANRSLIGLIEGLRSMGVNAVVGVPDLESDVARHLNSIEIQTIEIPMFWWCLPREYIEPPSKSPLKIYADLRRRFRRWKAAHRLANSLLSKVKKVNPDLVYTNSAVTPIGYLIARKLSIPHVWHLREYCDLDYDLILDLGKTVSSLLIGMSSRVICVSNSIKKHYFGTKNKGNTKVIQNGVYGRDEIERIFERRLKHTIASESFVFVLVGLLHPNKGQESAILAFSEAKKKVKNIKLEFVGGDHQGHILRLKSIASEHGVADDIHFSGFLNDPSEVLARADCALMCSSWEAFGRVTAEAMAMGLPVIGNESGGTCELIKDGVEGLLYDGSVDALAEKMIYLVNHRGFSIQLGRKGHERALVNFSIEKNCEEIHDLCLSILSDKSH